MVSRASFLFHEVTSYRIWNNLLPLVKALSSEIHTSLLILSSVADSMLTPKAEVKAVGLKVGSHKLEDHFASGDAAQVVSLGDHYD